MQAMQRGSNVVTSPSPDMRMLVRVCIPSPEPSPVHDLLGPTCWAARAHPPMARMHMCSLAPGHCVALASVLCMGLLHGGPHLTLCSTMSEHCTRSYHLTHSVYQLSRVSLTNRGRTEGASISPCPSVLQGWVCLVVASSSPLACLQFCLDYFL